jgi:Beta-lactamase enzyme family
VKHGPSHAGRLPGWERLVFGLVFALMAAFVVVATVSTVRSGQRDLPGAPAVPDSLVTPGGAGSSVQPAVAGGGSGDRRSHPARRNTALDKRLAAALRPEVRANQGRLAVGVVDLGTGAEAVYGASRKFRSAGLVTADILASLLLHNQQAGQPLTVGEAQLAVPMIESGDVSATTRLWRLAGRAAVSAANARLGLADTTTGAVRYWGLAKTTVADQLRLLTALASARSPLSAASRDYELGLMADAQPGHRWGACAAASPAMDCAVASGSLANPTRWVTDSIAVVDHGGRRLLIAVLSDGHISKAAGIAEVSAAARAAARVMT